MTSDQQKAMILIAGILGVGLLVFFARSSVQGCHTDGAGHQPLQESVENPSVDDVVASWSLAGPGNMLGINPHGNLSLETMLIHYFHPEGPLPLNPPNQQFTTPRHRYPTISGTNILTLMHRGYSPLMVPAPQDYDWMVNPPAQGML